MPLSNTTLDTLASQPYWDDFDATKNFHRVLIRPKVSVQTRELNQMQSILQNQVEQFGAGVFKDGATVRGGQPTFITSALALQLQRNDAVDIVNFYDETTGVGFIARGQTSGALGQIIEIARQSDETNTAVIYTPLNETQTSERKFQSEEIIEFINPETNAVVTTMVAARSDVATDSPVRPAVVYGVEAGVFFVSGHFVETTRQTTVLSSNGSNVSRRVGFDIFEEIITEIDDTSLLDPALGTTNYAAPGAHRLKLSLDLTNKPIFTSTTDIQTDEENFVELTRVINGSLSESPDRLEPTLLENTLAERTYDESGDYVVDPFVLIPTTHNPAQSVPNARGYLKILPTSNVVVSGDLASSFTVNPDTDVVTSVMTVFTEDVAVGDTLVVEDEERTVTEVVNNTVLRVNTTFLRSYTNTPFVVKSPAKMTLTLDPGRAYVRGYQIKTDATTYLEVDRPRDTKQIDNGAIQTSYGPYVLINRARGVFNPNTTPLLDLHCVPFAQINSSAYTDTKIGTTRFRMLVPDRTAGTIGAGDANTLYQFYYIAPEFTKKTYTSTPIVSVSVSNSTLTLNGISTGINTDSQAFTGATLSTYDTLGNTLRYTVLETTLSGNNTVLKLNPAAFLDIVNTTANVIIDFNEACIRGISQNASMLQGATVPVYGRVGQLANGNTQIYGSGISSELFQFREQWLKQGSLSDVSYDAFLYLGSVAQSASPSGNSQYDLSLAFPNVCSFNFTTASPVYDNFIVSNTTNGFASLVGASITAVTTNTATLVINTGSFGTASMYVKVRVTETATRNKLLIRANTTISNVEVTASANLVANTDRGHIAINLMNVASPSIVSLGIPDVYELKKVYVVTAVNSTQITTSVDVTDRYMLDTGQRDWCYDTASLVLKPGYGHYDTGGNYRLIAMVDWFQHTPNTGILTLESYYNSGLTDPYVDIPEYVSPTTNLKFPLRDYVDFRPLRTANTTEANTAHNPYVAANTFFQEQLHPNPNGSLSADYEHYLGRADKIVVNQAQGLQIISGISSVSPQPPSDIQNALTLYVVNYPPYLANVNSITYEPFYYRRYAMSDIAKLEKRIERLEYYAQISLLEDKTFTTPELDVNDEERFKNGILVDPFISSAVLDVNNPDTKCSIDVTDGGLYPRNTTYAFQLSNVATTSMTLHADKTLTLPYTHTPIITQSLASKHESVNPFSALLWRGNLTLSPDRDIWFSTSTPPAILNNQANSNDNLQVITQLFGSIWSYWTTYWEGNLTTASQNFEVNNFNVANPLRTQGFLRPPTGTITIELNGRRLNVSAVPYMRQKNVMLVATGLKPSVKLKAIFNGTDVTNFVERANELIFASAGSAAKFVPGRRITGKQSGSEVGNGLVVGVANNVVFVVDVEGKLYDAATTTIVEQVIPIAIANPETGSTYPQGTTQEVATGYKSFSGKLGAVSTTGASTITLGSGASSVASAYANAEIVITRNSGVGQRNRITAYDATTKVATLEFNLTSGVNTESYYSVGPLLTGGSSLDAAPVDGAYNEYGVLATIFNQTSTTGQPGSFYGYFRLSSGEEGRYPTGDRIFRLTDNTTIGLATTTADAIFRSVGIDYSIQGPRP